MVKRTILVVAGEVSGDIHAGNLLSELRGLCPEIEAFGIGGDRLSAAGQEQVATISELAHMGLVEVLRELPRIRRLMRRLVAESERRRPQLAVLVDSPDFNLRLAARLQTLGIPVVLYVSPQLWAWRKRRVRTVRRLAQEVLCLLPFEVPFYESHGMRARYVGHPLVDEIERVGLLAQPTKTEARRLALLPGSRAMEVRHLLPTMIQALAQLTTDQVSDAVLIEGPGLAEDISSVLASCASDSRLRRVSGENRSHALAGATLAWTASGTATLECALLRVPMVVGYRLQPISYAIARLLVRVPNVALVNLIAGSTVVPELLQKNWEPGQLARISRQLLLSDCEDQRRGLAIVRERLGGPGASLRAAEAIAEHLDNKNQST
jgi:lipid-A-disaccharide synthase